MLFAALGITPLQWTIGISLAAITFPASLALVSPAMFRRLAGRANRWVDTSAIVNRLDRSIDIDARVLPYSRLLGAAVLVSVGALVLVLAR